MKKLFLVFAVLFATVSSSFAYQQQTIYASHYSGGSGATVYVNSYVGSITLSASWSNQWSWYNSGGSVSAYAYGSSPSYSDSYSYYTSSSPSYSNTLNFGYNQPWIESIQFSLSAYECQGQATLTVN